MTPEIEPSVTVKLQRLDALSQWERAELGRDLRRAGWTYSEISDVIGAANSTIAGWCRGIEFSPSQVRAVRKRTGSSAGIPRDTQRQRRAQRAQIVERARQEAPERASDPAWIAGVVLYWGEGFKTENALGLANSDADLLRLFMNWTRTYLDPDVEFRAKLNLHASNHEPAAIDYWSEALNLCRTDFNKTFIKPEGTGHRRNHLEHGVIQVRARRSTDLFLRTAGWIEGLRFSWNTSSQAD